MAKLGFKDIIMKYLKKDEAFKLKYVDPLNKKNFHISYRSKGEAEAKMAQLKRDGVKDIQITQEDAPANATGTAVAGTGDDSSTVVVKKKKELQKNLMRRMGITEAIDRAIPDLEYPKDEIRERVNQLKDFASKSDINEISPAMRKFELEKQYKMILKDMPASERNTEAGKIRAMDLARVVATRAPGMTMRDLKILQKNKGTLKLEDLDAQPQDKDVKKVKGTQPKKYYKTLDKDTKKKRAAFFKKKAGTYKKSDDDDDYKAAPGDEKAKTKPSTFTKKFKQMYGDNYGYTAMHAKGVAKLNPLRRKDESK
jgi:hypothetical protein